MKILPFEKFIFEFRVLSENWFAEILFLINFEYFVISLVVESPLVPKNLFLRFIFMDEEIWFLFPILSNQTTQITLNCCSYSQIKSVISGEILGFSHEKLHYKHFEASHSFLLLWKISNYFIKKFTSSLFWFCRIIVLKSSLFTKRKFLNFISSSISLRLCQEETNILTY